ncbi:MAG: elongation factor Tu, partial [Gemmatimonadetes bacterium]|nr:elongation factor Tu [Gemmatimonadota bacterium]
FVLRGVIGAGQAVEAIGFSREAPQAFVVGRVESGRHRQKRARAGDTVDLVFENATIGGFDRGTVLAAPNTIASDTRFEALAYLRATGEGGIDGPVAGTWEPKIALWGVEMESRVRLREGAAATETIKPGAPVRIEVELAVPVAVERRLRFGIKEIGRTVGAGTVTRVTGESAAEAPEL